MKYMKNSTEIQLDNTAVTLGKFDGFHLGHQKLIRELQAAGDHLTTVLFTFAVSPGKIFHTDWKEILSGDERLLKYQELELDYVVEYPFTKKVMQMEPQEFIEEVLVRKLGANTIIVGRDYRFGYQRSGTVEILDKYSGKYGYKLVILDKVQYKEEEISSTRIRECILSGDMEQANAMLGYPYFIYGEVVHGNMLGRTMGLPTINQIPSRQKVLPQGGVYASRVEISGSSYYGITNVGCKPTVKSDQSMTVETFIFDFAQEVYGEKARVELYKYIRPEIRFQGIEQLKVQILKDIEQIQTYFQKSFH